MAHEMFAQVYSIHVEIMDTMMPVVVALLPNKDQVTYNRMIQLLQAAAHRLGHLFQPNIVCTDFEMSMINCISRVFPGSRIRGCLFHYSQCIWRKVQELGLVVRYKEDQPFNRVVRRASALPLVPPALVDDVWMEAMNEVNDEQAMRFLDYVTQTWVDNMAARFPMEMWNQYDNLAGRRTNNNLEAWHSLLNRELGRPHPNIYKFIIILQGKQQKFDQQLRLLEAGDAPIAPRRVYRELTERILRLKLRLERREITAYQYAGSVAGALKLGFVNN